MQVGVHQPGVGRPRPGPGRAARVTACSTNRRGMPAGGVARAPPGAATSPLSAGQLWGRRAVELAAAGRPIIAHAVVDRQVVQVAGGVEPLQQHRPAGRVGREQAHRAAAAPQLQGEVLVPGLRVRPGDLEDGRLAAWRGAPAAPARTPRAAARPSGVRSQRCSESPHQPGQPVQPRRRRSGSPRPGARAGAPPTTPVRRRSPGREPRERRRRRAPGQRPGPASARPSAAARSAPGGRPAPAAKALPSDSSSCGSSVAGQPRRGGRGGDRRTAGRSRAGERQRRRPAERLQLLRADAQRGQHGHRPGPPRPAALGGHHLEAVDGRAHRRRAASARPRRAGRPRRRASAPSRRAGPPRRPAAPSRADSSGRCAAEAPASAVRAAGLHGEALLRGQRRTGRAGAGGRRRARRRRRGRPGLVGAGEGSPAYERSGTRACAGPAPGPRPGGRAGAASRAAARRPGAADGGGERPAGRRHAARACSSSALVGDRLPGRQQGHPGRVVLEPHPAPGQQRWRRPAPRPRAANGAASGTAAAGAPFSPRMRQIMARRVRRCMRPAPRADRVVRHGRRGLESAARHIREEQGRQAAVEQQGRRSPDPRPGPGGARRPGPRGRGRRGDPGGQAAPRAHRGRPGPLPARPRRRLQHGAAADPRRGGRRHARGQRRPRRRRRDGRGALRPGGQLARVSTGR